MTVAVFAGFQSLLILNIWGTPEFFKTFNGFFVEFRSKFTNLGEIMDFQSSLLRIFYSISSVVHGGRGGGGGGGYFLE